MSSTGRLFFALWPDQAVALQLANLQAPLEGGRRSHVRDLHLTLAFLGVQPDSALVPLIDIVNSIEFNAIDVVIDKYGQFERQKVVWAGPSQMPPGLPELRSRLLQMPAMAAFKFRREAGFVPHVTLARKALMPNLGFDPIHWRAARFGLAESVGGQAAPRYRLLACREV